MVSRKSPDSGVRLHLATIGLGCNVGDREAILREAIQWIAARTGNRLKSCSSLYETEPFGKRDQAWFVNCVIQVETTRDLQDFFRLLQEGERRFGRMRRERWGPRTLDLDLLFFDDVVHSDSELTIPHPGVSSRRFVLEPLCEIAPGLVHPSLGETGCELLEKLDDPSRVIRLARPPHSEPH